MKTTPRDCPHGQLARQCPLCEREADHAALSRDLALALGYAPEHVAYGVDGGAYVWGDWPDWRGWFSGRPFDYRDPTVWGPVLEWLIKQDFATDRTYVGKFTVGSGRIQRWFTADTLPEADARAAIAVKEKA